MNANLRESLKRLRLSGLAQSLETRLQEATASRLNHQEFLELILQDELGSAKRSVGGSSDQSRRLP